MKDAKRAYYVLDMIRAHPHAVNMRWWVAKSDWPTLDKVTLADLTQQEPGCGTTACFAGWTVLLDGYKVVDNDQAVRGNTYRDVYDLAADLLGIGPADTDLLFYCHEDDLARIVEQAFGPDPR